MPNWVHTLTVKTFFDARLGVIGIGIVVQERGATGRRGPIIYQVSESAFVPIRQADAFGVQRALEVAIEQGYSRVNVRIDSTAERRRLRMARGRRRDTLDFTRARICDLARHFAWIGFDHVPGRRNKIARRLAQFACTGLEPPEVEPIDTVLEGFLDSPEDVNCFDRTDMFDLDTRMPR